MRPCPSTSACSSPRASRCRASCSPPWRSRTAASAATCARPTPRPSPTAPRPSSTCASPAARRRAACSRGSSRRRRRRPRQRRRRGRARRSRRRRAERGTRDAPVEAVFRMATRLNGKGSEKDTRHVVLDIAGSGLAYAPGDSFGLYPRNDPALAEAILAALRVPHDFPVGGKPIRDALIEDYALGARARHAVRADELPRRRRAAPEGQGAGQGRGPGRRRRHASTCWRCWRSSGRCIPIPRRSSSAWSRCSRGSTPSPPRRWSHRARCT